MALLKTIGDRYAIRSAPHGALVFYQSLMLHFKSDGYDALKYGFKLKHTPDARKFRARFMLENLVDRYTRFDRLIEFYIANIVDGKTFITDFDDDSYIRWEGRVQAVQYNFQKDAKILRESGKFDDLLRFSIDAQRVPVFALNLNLESLVVLDMLVNFTKQKINPTDDVIGHSIDKLKLIRKYRPFLAGLVDTAKAKKYLLDLYE